MNEADARKRLEELIELSGKTAGTEESTFDSPAQARAFGLVLALSREGAFEWDEFQQQLIDRIATDDGSLETETEATYYDHWIAALEGLLREKGELSTAELEERAAEFAAGDRDASEFVVGERTH
ncbi:nitrile hydratase accessory protein [Natronorubrum sp. FCH18a]|uniref:nitrile hydratase accessory protein n=1 Tax=Natronorubrum sp. FCH18a TaxID=3447018 RepID=UPI003F5105A8